MKLGVFTAILRDLPLEQALKRLSTLGIGCVEIGTGAYPGSQHADAQALVSESGRLEAFIAAVREGGFEISSLSCHGNPLHPDYSIGHAHHEVFRATVELAARIGVDVVTTFSGCPGDHLNARFPNWVTCYWPPDFQKILEWQWNKVAVPYWREQVRFAADHGVTKIAIEAHPGFLVYNPETLLRLRDACGDIIGINLDPSHFFWQGIDPIRAIAALSGTIHHVHAKDTMFRDKAQVHGVLDTTSSQDFAQRAWFFRTVGYGHGADFWCEFISALRLAGYDGAISIEHEDPLMSPMEGLQKAIDFLRPILLREPVTWQPVGNRPE